MVPLLVPEEEQLIFLDRSADVVTPIVVAQDRFVLVGAAINAVGYGVENVRSAIIDGVLGREPVVGIELVVAAAVEDAAMPLVGTALGHNIDHAARCLAIFRSISVADHLEFSD